MGVGMNLHDDVGGFVASRFLVLPGSYRLEVGEAMGLLEALSWIKSLGLQQVKIEVDAQLIVTALNTTRGVESVFYDYILACKRELSHLQEVSVSFVYRVANEKAHQITRLAKTFPSHQCWIEPPSFVVGLSNRTCIC
ncbi:hypothetical protein ACS0TY_030312 [Phlomoides rotata]